VRLDKLEGTRIDTKVNPDLVKFDVDVKMDEENRSSDELNISFLLTISTKPSLVKFVAGGRATVTGGRTAFESALTVDDKSGVPRVLHTIYQKVFTSIYLLASLIDAPYPPPDLIHSPTQAGLMEDQLMAQAAQLASQNA
jgi:hypothetical protein